MKVASNKVSDIKSFIRKRLHGLYPEEEITSFIYLLFEAYCGLTKTELLAGKREYINESELLLVYDAVKELEQQKPIQYITGKTFFYGMEFMVSPAVLIPRPETEELVALILKDNQNRTGLKILDIGTGSGCLAVCLKKFLPDAAVTAVDISKQALKIARENAVNNGVDINFLLFDILEERRWHELTDYDIIVSNPPYVLESEKALMKPNVLDYEPATALFVPDAAPLLYYEAIFGLAARQNKTTIIYTEINESKAVELLQMAHHYGIAECFTVKDINNKDRFFFGKVSS